MKKTKKIELPHTTVLRMGDWSHDGHGRTETVAIKSNLNRKQLWKAYKDGVEKVGLDVTNDVANYYEEPWMYAQQWRLLEKAGMTLKDLFGKEDKWELKEAQAQLNSDLENPAFTVYEQHFVKVWLFIAKQGNPDLEYEVTEKEDPIIEIGGYGLFSS